MTEVDGPLRVTPHMLIAALTELVGRYGADTINADRHNTGKPGFLCQYVAAELGVTWPEIHEAEVLVDYVDFAVNVDGPLHLTPISRNIWNRIDDLSDLGWTWGEILDLIEMDLPAEFREVPF